MSAQAGAHAFRMLHKNGTPLKEDRLTQNQINARSIFVALMSVLIIGFVLTNLLTFFSIIPILAEQGLNHLYTTIFSGMGFVGPHHHFSFGTIVAMSIGFLAAVDFMIGFGAVQVFKKINDHETRALTSKYPQKMENEICTYADNVCSNLDNITKSDADQPPRHLLLNYYNRLKADKASVLEPSAKAQTRSFNPL